MTFKIKQKKSVMKNLYVQEFKEFHKNVKTYYPLNKSRTRYLIVFKDNSYEFYKYNKKNKTFTKEKMRR